MNSEDKVKELTAVIEKASKELDKLWHSKTCGVYKVMMDLDKAIEPPFVPKEGQYIFVRPHAERGWAGPFQFVCMGGENGKHYCTGDGGEYSWEFARPLTDEEKGES